MQVSRGELDKVRSCKTQLNKMLARVVELKQVRCPAIILSDHTFLALID